MLNQGQNHIDSSANMVQKQAGYEVSAIIIQIILINKPKMKRTRKKRKQVKK